MNTSDSDPGHQVPRIAVDLRALVGVPSGIGFYTHSMLKALAQRGTAHYLGMAHRPIVDDRQLLDHGIEIEAHGGPLGVWWQQLILPKRLRTGPIDLLWSPITTLPVRLPVPGVVTVHDLTTLLHPQTHRLKVRLSVVPFLTNTLGKAKGIAADSEATAADLRRHYPSCASRIEVVYPGIDPEFRPGNADDIQATRAEVGCPDGYILYSGTLEPRKNIATLLTAWETLRQTQPAIPPLILTGPYGWRSVELLGRIQSLAAQGLHYLGRVPRQRLVRLMQAASIFVYPSLYEGFGLPPAEAMACGIPTIASNRSSLPEVVGDAGILFEPGDTAELAAALLRLQRESSLAVELGNRGWRRAQQFRWERSAELMDQLFQRSLA
jgi:glycosyltransferase involved in cell wall biosynthesis